MLGPMIGPGCHICNHIKAHVRSHVKAHIRSHMKTNIRSGTYNTILEADEEIVGQRGGAARPMAPREKREDW